jgi:TRAP-type mannitol/chloroaromatic compound transport system substrate-binding protein
VKSFPDEVWDSFGEASAEVYEEVRDHSALAKKIDDAFQKALKEIGGTIAQFEGTFVNQRNRVLGLEA